MDEYAIATLPLDDHMQKVLEDARVQAENPGSILSNYVVINGIHDGGLTSYSRIINVIKFSDEANPEGDSAILTKGGIDFNPAMVDMDIHKKGSGLEMPAPNLEQINQFINTNSFVPVILNVSPVTSLPSLLGLISEPPKEQLSNL